MLEITSITIQERNKKRCNLFVDGEFFVGISLESVLKYRLKKGLKLSEKELSTIVFENSKTDALALAINYVSKNLKTKKQVKTYLTGKGFSEEIVWYCIDKLKDYKYIDDVEYAKRYIESTSNNQGRRLIEYKLMSKGVKKEDIAIAYEDCVAQNDENAFNVAKKHIKNKEINKENLSKTYRYLISRGFTYEETNNAISKIKDDDEWKEY